MTKQSKAFNWKGAQGELVRMMIAEGKIPPNPTKTQYKAVYDASEGDVLKFQNFHSSWKNVSRNLAASGAVLGSTGLCRSAANDQMGDRGVAEASVDCLVAPEVAFRKKNKKGVLEASGDLYWPTFHSYWHDKHKNLRLHFFVVLPSGCRAEDIKVTIPNRKKISIVHKWPDFLFDPERLFEGQRVRGGGVESNASSAKSAGLLEMKEKVKKDENQPATTSLAINLEQDVEQNMIELSGEVVTRPSFYRIDGDGASGSELPTLMMAIPLMVKRATEGYAMDEEEVEDYE